MERQAADLGAPDSEKPWPRVLSALAVLIDAKIGKVQRPYNLDIFTPVLSVKRS
jgi:hypothetical protein